MKRSLIVAALLGMMTVQSIFAVGALFARRPGTTETMSLLWLTNYNADVTITDQIAVTHVDQTFKNETSMQLEGVFVFPLPSGAVVTELALWINGQRVVASVKDQDTARRIFDSLIRPRTDPALLEYMGNNAFQLRVFPIDPAGRPMAERRVEITYAELLPYTMSQVDYRFFMKTTNASPKAVVRSSLTYALTSQKKLTSLYSPSHETSPGYYVTKTSDYKYTGVFGNENSFSDKDFKLTYKFESNSYALNNLTYVPQSGANAQFFDSTGDDSYYVMWVTTPDTVKILKKDVVFIADISSSMAGKRIVQVRNALAAMIGMLNPGDKFNVVVFSTSARAFKTDLVAADSANKLAATDFVNQLTEMGLTNMEDAFKIGLKASWDQTTVNSAVFLTDGKPTWPATSTPQTVRDTVRAYNTAKAAIYTFSIGEDVDESFLNLLAKENGGSFTAISVDDSIAPVMTAFMRMISYPLIKNCALAYGGLSTYDVLPNPLPNLVATAQLTVLGRFKGAGSYDVAFTGTAGSDPFSLSQRLAFPGTGSYPFVARMWASAKIGALLDQIATYGERPELKDAVKKLGLKYGLVTPYTSLIAIEPSRVNRPIEDKTAGRLLMFGLAPCVPNPIASSATLTYTIPRRVMPQAVAINIYDAKGRLVRRLVNDITMGGKFIVQWDVRDDIGKKVAAGLYFAIMEAPEGRTMIHMRVM